MSIGVPGPLKDLEGDVSAPYASLQGGTSGTLLAAVILSALGLVHRSGTPEHCVALEVTGGKALSPLHGGGPGARPLPPAAPASLPAAPVAALLDPAQVGAIPRPPSDPTPTAQTLGPRARAAAQVTVSRTLGCLRVGSPFPAASEGGAGELQRLRCAAESGHLGNLGGNLGFGRGLQGSEWEERRLGCTGHLDLHSEDATSQGEL